MKEQEAIRILGDTTLCTPLGQAAFVAIEDIKKLQQYQALGTVEELWEARERQRAKKPIAKNLARKIFMCQCGNTQINITDNFCGACGQAIDWNEE